MEETHAVRRLWKFTIIWEREFYLRVLAIMVPVVLQQAINMGVNMLDTMMLGSFGEIQLSGSSLANTFYSLFSIGCMGILGGCNVLVSQYWGAGDRDRARQTFVMALQLTVIWSLIFAVITALFPEPIMAIYTDELPVIQQGARYLRVTVFIYLIHGISLVWANLMRAVGVPRLGLYVSLVSFLVNIGANYVFIFGKFGAPRLEIAGAAVGTLIARGCEFVITVGYILLRDNHLGLRLRDLARLPGRLFYKNYFKLGAPVLISDGLLALGSTIVSMVLGRMGNAVVASNAICQVVDRLSTVVIQGISNASAIVIGHTVGAGNYKKAMAQGETFYFLSILFGLFSALLFWVVAPITLRFYTLEPETLRIVKEMILAYLLVVFFQAIQSTMTKGVLRGGGDTQFLMKADILFMWLLSIPLGAVGGLLLGWPGWLTTICLRVDYIVKSVWCIWRLLSGRWIRRIEEDVPAPDPVG